MTDQELIQALTEAGNSDKFIRRADYWAMCCREAASRLATLQSENAEKGKEIERLTKKATLNAFIKYTMKRACEELAETESVFSRVEAERDAAMKALEDMRFDYINKDADCPHQFESEALACAERLLEQWRGVQGGVE